MVVRNSFVVEFLKSCARLVGWGFEDLSLMLRMIFAGESKYCTAIWVCLDLENSMIDGENANIAILLEGTAKNVH